MSYGLMAFYYFKFFETIYSLFLEVLSDYIYCAFSYSLIAKYPMTLNKYVAKFRIWFLISMPNPVHQVELADSIVCNSLFCYLCLQVSANEMYHLLVTSYAIMIPLSGVVSHRWETPRANMAF